MTIETKQKNVSRLVRKQNTTEKYCSKKTLNKISKDSKNGCVSKYGLETVFSRTTFFPLL